MALVKGRYISAIGKAELGIHRGDIVYYHPVQNATRVMCRVYRDRRGNGYIGMIPEYSLERVKPFSKYFGQMYGLPTFGGKNGMRFAVSWGWSAVKGWKEFYKGNAPWTKWFSNPIWDNKSGYDELLGRKRTRFCVCGLVVQW